jgi:hypothetical protein
MVPVGKLASFGVSLRMSASASGLIVLRLSVLLFLGDLYAFDGSLKL